MVLIVIALIVVSLIQCLCLFALVDQYKSLLQIRDALRLVDTPNELPLLGLDEVRPSALGLPAAIDTEPFAVVLLLSTKCTTCRAVAKGMGGHVPSTCWVVVEGRGEPEIRSFREETGLLSGAIFADPGGRIAEKLRAHVFPSAVVFVRGVAQTARSIPSYRQLTQLLSRSDQSQLVPSLIQSGG